MVRISIAVASVVLALVAVGCGEGAPTRRVDDVSPAGSGFYGSWSATGSVTRKFETSEGSHSDTQPVSGMVAQIAEGADSELIFLFSDCQFPASMKGDVAFIPSGASCSGRDTDGGQLTMTVKSGNATLNGNIIQFAASGSLTYVYGGLTYPGTWTWQLSLTKLTK
jgi:hypothetical protein